MNAFFKSQFNYCHITWMCCNLSLKNKINRRHKQCLHIVHNHKNETFNDFSKEIIVSIHHQNIRFLAIELFKFFKSISPQIVKDTVQVQDEVPCQLRKQADFWIPFVHIVFSGTKCIKFLGPNAWEILLHEIKQLESLEEFRKAIK